jgi:diguanylate cyclase (GGDEF)-like protein/PAS domain S-box-containing protein
MRSMLSQDEIGGQLSAAAVDDLSMSDRWELHQTGVADHVKDSGCPASVPAVELEAEKRFGEASNHEFSVRIMIPNSCVTSAEAASLAILLHTSLTIEDILRRSHQVLSEHFFLGRLSLVQLRASESAATVYSIDEDAMSPLLGPHVITVEGSRLKECLFEQREIISESLRVSELDDTEREYLLSMRPSSDAYRIVYWPLMLGGMPKGALVLELSENELMTPTRTGFLFHLAEHLAIAIENSDRYYMERRLCRQATILNEIARRAVRAQDLNEFFPEVCELLRRSFDYNYVQIWIETCNVLELRGEKGRSSGDVFGDQHVPEIVHECIRRSEIIFDNNLRTDSAAASKLEGGSQLAVPIQLRGRGLGVIVLKSGRLDAFATEDRNAMEGIASLMASTLQNSQKFKSSLRSGEYLQAIIESAGDWAIISTDINGYVFSCSVGTQKIFRRPQREILEKDVLNLFSDPRIQRELISHVNGSNRTPCFERCNVPQIIGKLTAYLDVTFQPAYDSGRHQIGFLCVVRDVTEKVLLEQRLKKLLITDDLTALFNQRGFYQVIEAEMRQCRKFHHNLSLCLLDLDGVKQLNHEHGHVRGDRVLRETARLLRESVREGVESCCRYGGAEFAIIMPQSDKFSAQVLVEKIRVKLCEHFKDKITTSFGIADLSDNIVKAADLLARADHAMYRAKCQGKNCIVVAD